MRSTAPRSAGHAAGLLEKVRNLISDLQRVQEELCRQLALPDGTPRQNVRSADLRSAGDLETLKTTVDQFRRVLWFYVDRLEHGLDPGLTKPQSEKYRLQAVPQSLELQRSASEAGAQQPISFFDRLELVIEGYLQPCEPLAPNRPKLKSQ